MSYRWELMVSVLLTSRGDVDDQMTDSALKDLEGEVQSIMIC